jgi:DNA-binding transcriptional ArsR family regulator
MIPFSPYSSADRRNDVSDHAHPVDPDWVAAAREGGVDAGEAHGMGALLTLLADPLRTRILSALLVTEEMCVGDIALALSASEDSVTYALRLLRIAGLVVRRREGRMGYYRLRDGEARDELQASLERIRRLACLHPESQVSDDDDN